jgi:carbon-monoxide dehydrogenase medium subunit
MKPAPFEYRRASSVKHALDVLAGEPEAKLLAGGQSLIPLLNFRLATPPVLVDIGRLDGALTAIGTEGAAVVLGANVRTAQIERDPTVAERAPLLAMAARHVAHPAIRNRGTLGGAVAHADPAAEFPAALCALGATIVVAGRGRERHVPADEFFVAPLTPALEPAEMVVAVRVPAAGPRDRHGFAELARRSGDYGYAGCAVRLLLDGDRLAGVRIALLGVGPTPVLAREAMAMLDGQRPTRPLIDTAANTVARTVTPVDDVHASAEYRREAARLVTIRALVSATLSPGIAADPRDQR